MKFHSLFQASVIKSRPTVGSQMHQDLTTKPDSSNGNLELNHETVTSNGSSEATLSHNETTASSSEHT